MLWISSLQDRQAKHLQSGRAGSLKHVPGFAVALSYSCHWARIPSCKEFLMDVVCHRNQ